MYALSADPAERIATSVQSLFRANPLLLIGSGFSCGYGLPSMAQLGEHLAEYVAPQLSSASAQALWASALPAVQVNLEQGLNTIASGAEGRDEVVTAIRMETSRLIIRRTREAEAQILSSTDRSIQAPTRLLKRLYSGARQNAECIPVITTNYDTLIELFCDLADLPLDTGFAGFRRRRARAAPIFQTQYRRIIAPGPRSSNYAHRACLNVRLIKPHGSITWQSNDGVPFEVLNDQSDSLREIAIPGPTKYEDALINTLFDGMRGEMKTAVSRASALLCIGFGFNDPHLDGAIRTRLEAGMPTLILTRDFTSNIESIIDRYPNVVGVRSQGSGAEARSDGEAVFFATPVWKLDVFLKTYLES